MILKKCSLDDALIITPEFMRDERGFFARAFCQEELRNAGIQFHCCQSNFSYNEKKDTLRGMHYQREPYSESKIVTCISGSIYDVIIDLRQNSNTYLKWEGFYLQADSYTSLYIPKGFAHGFVTLEDSTCLYYLMSEMYHKGYEAGIRYDDPCIGVQWPVTDDLIISEKDRKYELLGDIE